MKFHLHIGLEKTGTTFIQKTLSNNLESLLNQGYAYYTSPFVNRRGRNYFAAELLPYALASDSEYKLKSMYVGDGRKSLIRFRKKFRKTVLAFSKKHAHADLVFSIEQLSRYLKHEDEWRRLNSLIEDCQRIPVVHVYLRCQDDFCLSFYPTSLILGKVKPFEFPRIAGANDFLNYRDFLQGLAGVFGEQNLRVYSYEADAKAGGGSLEHFSSQLGIDCSGFALAADSNQRMGIKESEFLRQLNIFIKQQGKPRIGPRTRKQLRYVLQSMCISDEQFEPGHDRRVGFLRPLFSGNRFVNDQYFGGRTILAQSEADVMDRAETTARLEPSDCINIAYRVLSLDRHWSRGVVERSNGSM